MQRFLSVPYCERVNSPVCFKYKNTPPKLNDKDKHFCDTRLSDTDYLQSLKELPNNKSPGSDGLPIEFYKFFWNNIKDFVIDSFNYSFDHNRLSIEQRRAILTLLPKDSKDLRLLKN